ncbi:glycosyl hydrolase family 18 protein [Serpentinicella alkaliphila]|uniref:Glycosyl hydrolase family 18 (Putative chitinase) n=1 Tax=Serpentinicella alkaliphila TaxID=1734049 RepID=A0A4R2TUL9_9FIRM|nr:glycosyl hydrolase family 18 protein [Serpentinicella alkaliphila]QUH25622.1 hypothetical protein HZR23_07660 [Serpentinicella alkaliphila]TCQ06667.1 glycosyl hydrolase family 18 (putative chitinase) [Serpentinicella alkaliphila]
MRLQRNTQKRNRLRTILLALIFILSLGTYYFYTNLDSVINTFSSSEINDEFNLIIDNKGFLSELIIDGEEIYLPLEKVQEHIYQNIILDSEQRYGLVQLKNEHFYFSNADVDSYVKESPVTISFLIKKIDDTIFFPVKSTASLLGAQIDYFSDRDLLLITSNHSEYLIGKAIGDTSLKENDNTISKSITTIPKDSYIQIYESLDKYKVITPDGYRGYVSKSNIDVNTTSTTSIRHELNNANSYWSPPKQIGLVWDYIKYNNHDRTEQDKLNAVDILSPTWFRMVQEDGTILNSGNTNYVKDAKSKGYKIWGLVTNSFDPDLTSKFLDNKEAQNNFIRQILVYSAFYDLDGINIDFENIHYRDKDAFTSFVRFLTQKLHEQNLVVSIDVTIPSSSPNWSMVYDRAKLGEIVDYVAIMTYDEHWSSSPKSGSVASIGWVERGIQRTLDVIPPEKVLLGLPFYTRLWEEELLANNRVKVSSKAYGMNRVMEILEENNASIEWDELTGQYYSQYESEGKLYRVWLECDRSLALKASLIEKHNLAGYAAWRKDFEKDEVWLALDSIVKQGKSYNLLVFNEHIKY